LNTYLQCPLVCMNIINESIEIEIEIDLYSRVLPCPVQRFCCPIGDS
jgi:hypothetical protein